MGLLAVLGLLPPQIRSPTKDENPADTGGERRRRADVGSLQSSVLSDRALAALADTNSQAEDVGRARQAFRIPFDPASGQGGWVVHAGGTRRIDLSRSTQGHSPPLYQGVLSHLADVDEGPRSAGASVTRQLDALAADDPDFDPALVLMIASREASPGAVLTASRDQIETYDSGGLDNLGSLVRRHRITPPQGFGPWAPYAVGDGNEHGVRVTAAYVPRNEQLVAYGLVIRRARETFMRRARDVMASRPDVLAQLHHLPIEVLRVWTQIAFGASGGAPFVRGRNVGGRFGVRTALEILLRAIEEGRAKGFEDVLNLPELQEFDVVRRGLVTAAESTLLAHALGI
jgi:hypothetical protein